MFEYFFAKKINDRQRDIALRELNSVLLGNHAERQGATRDEQVLADSATSLPLGFVDRFASLPE
jgi:hypothetical protein